MPIYSCEVCKFNSTLKGDYVRHLNTKKHKRNISQIESNDTNHVKMSQNEPKMSQNEPKRANNFHCKFCDKGFSTKANLRRHELHRCKENDNSLAVKLNNTNKLLQQEKKEKDKLYKHIESLLEKVGDTINNNTINQTNNIVLNNYGQEDLSHITSKVLDKLITAPCQMVNNLTKMIHFNKEKPENMNIYIPNKKQKYLKIFKDDKWILEDKNERIPDIIDKNYFILDSHYGDNGGNEKLDKFINKNYKMYQGKMDNKDKETHQKEYDACELEILNNTKLVMDNHNIKN